MAGFQPLAKTKQELKTLIGKTQFTILSLNQIVPQRRESSTMVALTPNTRDFFTDDESEESQRLELASILSWTRRARTACVDTRTD